MTTPTESWEKEFDEFYTLPENAVPGPQRENAIKDFIRTKLDEAYRKGREDAVGYIEEHIIDRATDATKVEGKWVTIEHELDLLQGLLDEARHTDLSDK